MSVDSEDGLDTLMSDSSGDHDLIFSMSELSLCDYCDQPCTNATTAFGQLCRRHYGYVELATVICYPERVTAQWSQRRGARIRLSA